MSRRKIEIIIKLNSTREPIEFWTVLGGQDPYAHNKIPKERLFTMETGPDGSIEAVEVFDFEQSNLSDRRVAILDAGDTVYIWVGSRSVSFCINKIKIAGCVL